MSHIGRETFVESGGKRYRLSRYTRTLDDVFVEWCLSQLPDPIATARKDIEGFPPELQKMIVQEAMEVKRKRETGTSDEIAEFRSSNKGLWKILCLCFQRYHPDLTEADVAAIYDDCLLEHGPDYLPNKVAEASGTVKKKDLPAEDPSKKNVT